MKSVRSAYEIWIRSAEDGRWIPMNPSDDQIVSEEAGRQFSEHLNKGRKIIVISEFEFARGERVDGMSLTDEAGVERWWNQPFVITREATREEFEAERLPSSPAKLAHSAGARYYEVMAD